MGQEDRNGDGVLSSWKSIGPESTITSAIIGTGIGYWNTFYVCDDFPR